MSDALFPYYERELLFVRQLSQEFAKLYPAAAGRLLLEPNRSVDPHVERLIESFALLAARIHHKLDDEFPELTDALLSVLYPHYLAPIPSVAICQFEPTADFSEGSLVPRGTMLESEPIEGDVERVSGDAAARGLSSERADAGCEIGPRRGREQNCSGRRKAGNDQAFHGPIIRDSQILVETARLRLG